MSGEHGVGRHGERGRRRPSHEVDAWASVGPCVRIAPTLHAAVVSR